MTRIGGVAVQIQVVDALELQCDVLALKYAQSLFGADRMAVDRLVGTYPRIHHELPLPGGSRAYPSPHRQGPAAFLFIGVPMLRDFLYDEIRDFGTRAVSVMATQFPEATSLGVTVHGVNFGLDELASFEAEVAGLRAGLAVSRPAALERIVFAERDTGRAERLGHYLEDLADPDTSPNVSFGVDAAPEPERTYGPDRPTVFVAMPFHPDFEDVFNFGIQGALHDAGLKCERLDQASFFGDVIQEMRRRIARSRFVVADLTGANPNVYLEVGYAWAAEKPVVLVVSAKAREESLKFDVQNHRHLGYANITELRKKLFEEITSLLEQNLV